MTNLSWGEKEMVERVSQHWGWVTQANMARESRNSCRLSVTRRNFPSRPGRTFTLASLRDGKFCFFRIFRGLDLHLT